MLASLLAVGHAFEREPFWNITANGLISGLIAHIATYPAQERHLGHLRGWLYHDDMDLAMREEEMATRSESAQRERLRQARAAAGAVPWRTVPPTRQ